MRKTQNRSEYPNLVGWLSTPLERSVVTDVDKSIFMMTRAALNAVIKTAFSTDEGNRCLWPMRKSDEQMFGTSAIENRFEWRAISADRLTGRKQLGEITGRLHEGVLVYNAEMRRVFTDLGVLVGSQEYPDSAAHIQDDRFGLTEPGDSFRPYDRRFDMSS